MWPGARPPPGLREPESNSSSEHDGRDSDDEAKGDDPPAEELSASQVLVGETKPYRNPIGVEPEASPVGAKGFHEGGDDQSRSQQVTGDGSEEDEESGDAESGPSEKAFQQVERRAGDLSAREKVVGEVLGSEGLGRAKGGERGFGVVGSFVAM